jgi:hypothetical protein
VNWCVHSNSAVLVPTQIGATLSMRGDSPRCLLPHPAPVLLEGGPEAAHAQHEHGHGEGQRGGQLRGEAAAVCLCRECSGGATGLAGAAEGRALYYLTAAGELEVMRGCQAVLHHTEALLSKLLFAGSRLPAACVSCGATLQPQKNVPLLSPGLW